jgi:hypothetical protein
MVYADFLTRYDYYKGLQSVISSVALVLIVKIQTQDNPVQSVVLHTQCNCWNASHLLYYSDESVAVIWM